MPTIDLETAERLILGRRLAEARKRAGWSQTDAALRAEVDSMTISRWERGERQPTYSLLNRYVVALGADPASILGPLPKRLDFDDAPAATGRKKRGRAAG